MKITFSISLAFKTFPLLPLITQQKTLLHLHNYQQARLKIWSLRFHPFQRLKGWLLISNIRSGPYIQRYHLTISPTRPSPEKETTQPPNRCEIFTETPPRWIASAAQLHEQFCSFLPLPSESTRLRIDCVWVDSYTYRPTVNLPPLDIPPEIRPAFCSP